MRRTSKPEVQFQCDGRLYVGANIKVQFDLDCGQKLTTIQLSISAIAELLVWVQMDEQFGTTKEPKSFLSDVSWAQNVRKMLIEITTLPETS